MQVESVKLIYFSPTGTTKKITEHIVEGLNLAPNMIDLTLPKARDNYSYTVEEDLVIIGFPVYAQRMPNFLFRCFKNIKGNNKPLVIVCVYGNIDVGIALRELHNLCTERGFHVIAAGLFIGQHSFCSEELKVASGRPDIQDLSIARDFGLQIRRKLAAGKELKNLLLSMPRGRLSIAGRLVPPYGERLVTHQPRADNSCSSCRVCAATCPMGAIVPDSLEIIEELCLRCFRCTRQCPEQARKISFKKKWIIKSYLSIKGKKRKEPILYI